jgi:fumarylacetoacetase
MAMIYPLNETHDPQARSWVESANLAGNPFPIQNLPFGVYRTESSQSRIGVAIGDMVLDLCATAEAGLLYSISGATQTACRSRNLNELLSLTPLHWSELRLQLFRLLHTSAIPQQQEDIKALLHPRTAVVMELPCQIGDYTDFYAGIFHATNVGSLFRPQTPLLPNYKWLPIAYHARSSSIVISGTQIRRPNGQTKLPDSDAPTYGPSRQLDFELELGLYIGSGNELGEPIPIEQAEENIFGLCLLNDWSARDIQSWEYQPLGPFLAKNFATTVSPWIVTLEALTPFRCPAFTRAEGDPKPLPYLSLSNEDGATHGIDISLEVALSTREMREHGLESHIICRGSSRDLYWTISQLVAHHASSGCNLRPGDLLGSGTISGRTNDSCGSLLEMTKQGRSVIELPTGQQRTYLEPGDEVVIRGWCHNRSHVQIGFGECLGRIQA